MINKDKEQKHLDFVRSEIATQKEKHENAVINLEKIILESQTYLKEHRSTMKFDDIPARVAQINKMIEDFDIMTRQLKILIASLASPYFGGIKFSGERFYIGKFGVQNTIGTDVIINDWRAPISSLFYDYELGDAKYQTPDGIVQGKLEEKLQYKIENGVLQYVFDTSLTINDEILKEALAESSGNQMKTIVATIQKKQNEIIRKGLSKTTIVQGVAGSGKTSIALHRIAFLLYNNRKHLTSQNILIFSPNKVFSSYISSVLPELGENNVKEISFDDIFKSEFGAICGFERRHNQVEKALSGANIKQKETTYKNSEQFVIDLKEYLDALWQTCFKARAVKIGSQEFSEETIAGYAKSRNKGSINDKIKFVSGAIVSLVEIARKLSTKGELVVTTQAYNAVLKMFKRKNIFKIYTDFLYTKKIHFTPPSVLSVEDALGLLFIKNYIFGANTDESIKHLVIDEMQDYNGTALAIINQMFSCPKTILGDFHQTVDCEYNEKKLEIIVRMFADGNEEQVLRLNRNYRSSFEIAEFANKILGVTNKESPIRHGDVPIIKKIKASEYKNTIPKIIDELLLKHKSIGILTKTTGEAIKLYGEIKDKGRTINLITPESETLNEGVSIAAAHVVKGLEFDAVIIINAEDTNFKTLIDRQSLYIAATRALHKIIVLFEERLTEFIKN